MKCVYRFSYIFTLWIEFAVNGGGSQVHEVTKSEGIRSKEMIIDYSHLEIMGEAPGRPEEANLTHGGGQIGVGRVKGGMSPTKKREGSTATLEERISPERHTMS